MTGAQTCALPIYLLVLRDVTDRLADARTSVLLVGAICIAIGGGLLGLFYVILTRTERKLENARRRLIEESRSREAAQEQHLRELGKEKAALQQTQEALEQRVEEMIAAREAGLNIMEDADETRKKAEEAEEALRKAHDHLQSVIDAIADPILVVDLDYHVVLANQAVRELVDGEDPVALGLTCYQVSHHRASPCEGTNDPCPLKQVIATKAPVKTTHTHFDAKGEQRVMEIVAWPLFDEAGEVVQMIEVCCDITERKQAELALRENERKYAQLIEQSPDPILFMTHEGKLGSVNAAAEKVSGYSAGDLLGKHFTELGIIAPETLDEVIGEFARLLAGEDCPPFEMTIIHKGGARRLLEANPRVMRQGDAPPGIQIILRDITERKQTEERLRRVNRLQSDLLKPGNLDEKLKRVTDSVVDIFDVDFARIWITQPGDLCESGCMHAEVTEGPHVCKYRDRCLRLRASSGRYTHIDGKVHRRVPFGCYKIGLIASGQDRKFLTNDVTHDPHVHNNDWAAECGLVSFAGYQIRPPGEDTIGVLALFAKHAITPGEDALLESLANTLAHVVQTMRAQEAEEQAKLEAERRAEEIQKVNRKLEGAVTEKNEFLRAVSHDLSAPLRNVSGMASFVKSRYADKLDDIGRDRLDRIMNNIKNQNELIQDLLELSRIKTRRGSFQRTDTAGVLRAIVEQFAFDLDKKSGIVELEGEFPIIWCESNRLRQVFQNLIDNAIKYAHPDRPCRIVVTSSQDHSDYRFSLTDNGIGMKPEEADKAFFVFQRAHNSMTARIAGKGVGLATVKSIIENYGGEIWIESRQGEGSTFTFTLPKATVGVPPAQGESNDADEPDGVIDAESETGKDFEVLNIPGK